MMQFVVFTAECFVKCDTRMGMKVSDISTLNNKLFKIMGVTAPVLRYGNLMYG